MVQFSVIIPAYNEAVGITQTLAALCQYPGLDQAEIIVVDDGSTDETAMQVAAFPRIQLVCHKTNKGYGAAIATGVRASHGQYVVWYDADGQHRPEDLLTVVGTLIENDLDYCIGIRGAQSYEDPRRRLGKFILRQVVKLVVDQPVPDFNSGLRGFRKEVLAQYLHLLPKRFGASTMTTLLMIERNHVGESVPIVVQQRVGTSSVRQLRDGVATLMIILRIILLFKPMLFFGGIGAALIVGGSLYGFVEAFSVREGFPVFGALIIILGVQALFFGLLNDQISLMRRERLD
jgi:glycosyltransferase involved in cell wall biosynthesis